MMAAGMPGGMTSALGRPTTGAVPQLWETPTMNRSSSQKLSNGNKASDGSTLNTRRRSHCGEGDEDGQYTSRPPPQLTARGGAKTEQPSAPPAPPVPPMRELSRRRSHLEDVQEHSERAPSVRRSSCLAAAAVNGGPAPLALQQGGTQRGVVQL